MHPTKTFSLSKGQRASFQLGLGLVVIFALMAGLPADAAEPDTDPWQWSGDLRLRFESDFDSTRPDGSERRDRDRLRIRARLAIDYSSRPGLRFGVRLRSGSRHSHQSPHVTLRDFDGGERGDSDLNVDRLFVRLEKDSYWFVVGRQNLPFWKQNELFWDDDVTPIGVAGGWNHKAGNGRDTAFRLGALSPPVGMRDFTGRLSVAQWTSSSGPWTVALGMLDFDAGDNSTADRLLQGNGRRDYRLWIADLQHRTVLAGRPLTLGLDLAHNSKGYNRQIEDRADEVDAWVLSARLDNLASDRGTFTWTYAHVESLAVIGSYAQDDWMRWGSAVETRASNFSGHELRFTFDLGRRGNLVLRYYDAQSLTSIEDGRRLRLDWNLRL